MLTPVQQQRLLREAQGLANNRPRASLFRTWGRRFGPFGELLGLVADTLRADRIPNSSEIVQAIKLLTDAGFDVRPGGTSRQITPPPIQQPPIVRQPGYGDQRSPSPPRRVTFPKAGTVSSRVSRVAEVPRVGDIESSWPEEHDLHTSTRQALLERPDQSIFSDANIQLFPSSSNVYGATYDAHQQVAFISFKIGSPIEYVDKVNSCNGRRYKMGIKPNQQGPMYAYGSAARPFTENMWQDFLSAPSKGEWVWHNLRECGSLHGHQMPYNLVSPAKIGGGLLYVPRKATKRGYRVRQVPVPGSGRRKTIRSTLPEQLF